MPGVIRLVLLSSLLSAAAPAFADNDEPNQLQPVWQLEVAEPPGEPGSSGPEVPFPEPQIIRNEFAGRTGGTRFPLESITLFRYQSLGGGFEINTLVGIVRLKSDGTPAGPPLKPLPITCVGLTIRGFPCVAESTASSEADTFRVLSRGDENVTLSTRYNGLHYMSDVGIVTGTTGNAGYMSSTEVFAFGTGRRLTLPGFCTITAANHKTGIAALPMTNNHDRTCQLVVVNSSGEIVLQKRLPAVAQDIGLQPDWAIISFGWPKPKEIAIRLPSGEADEVPALPPGLRTFSEDGRTLLILDNSSTPDTLRYYDIDNPLAPKLLWTRPMPETRPFVTGTAVSPSGRLVAWHLQAENTTNSLLMVVSREGRDLGYVAHHEPYLVDGAAFVDDRFLLEGIYREGFVLDTRTARLYDFGKGPR